MDQTSDKKDKKVQVQCQRCGLQKEMTSANFYFVTHNQFYYVCDECKTSEAVKVILGALAHCSHLIDMGKIEKILEIVCKSDE